MKKYCVLYNPYSGTKKGEKYARELDNIIDGNLVYYSLLDINNYKDFFGEHREDIIICGGDGTLNYFVNEVKDIKYKNKILYYSTGSGNDFYNEVGNNIKKPFLINKYIDELPNLSVNNKEYLFVNGVGGGLDGYCCEVAKELKAKKNKSTNYTFIALKGLLYKFKPVMARVIVDGVEYSYKNVWLVSIMNGKYFGGGMKIAPNQDRLCKDHQLSVVITHGKSRLYILFFFPLIYSGKHVKKTKNVSVITGKNIKVIFDRKCFLQYDGDSLSGVKEFVVNSYYK